MTRADILAAGFAPMLDQHYVENPLRTYLVVPVRTDDGVWFGVPMFYGVTADVELIREAEQIARTRYRQKIT
jgi:hypothetical protein